MKRKLILLFASIFTFCALIFLFVRDEVQDFIIEQQLENRSDVENTGLTCIQKLEKKGVEFVELQKFGQPKCIVKEPVRIENYPTTKLSGPVTLNCSTALNLANWLEEIGANEVEHFGSYNCRTIRGSSIMSQHSYRSDLRSPALTGLLFYLIGQMRLKSRSFSKMQEKQPTIILQMSLRRITIRRIKITSILMTGISQHVKNQLIVK